MSENEANRLETTKTIFFHNIDEYQMAIITKLLIDTNLEKNWEKYKICGSISHSDNLAKVMNDRYPVQLLNPQYSSCLQMIIDCDILVFNIDSPNFEQVCIDCRKIMKSLEEWANKEKPTEFQSKKYLILLSTPMTWALTPPGIVTNEDDEEELSDHLHEDDYRRRKAHKNYCKHKLLERDVIWFQKRCKHFIKTLVVCPGIIYGEQNNILHYVFKLSFYNKLVPIVRPGSQLIPMIYAKDFAQIMKNIFDDFPESKIRFIFAVQKQLIDLKAFTYKICKVFNGDCSKIRFLREIELLIMDKDLFPQSVIDALSLNIKLTSSYLKNFKFVEMDNKFWETLRQEFCDSRNLHPLRLVIDGPPLVGKTEHAQKLSEFYQLLYIDINEIMNLYIKYLEEKINDSIIVLETFNCPDQIFQGEEEESGEDDIRKERWRKLSGETQGEEEGLNKFDKEDESLIADLKKRVDAWSKELFQLKVYIASHKIFEEQEFSEISRCLIGLISTKLYNENQGYIIDGFPFTYNQANQIYYNSRKIITPRVSVKGTPRQSLKDTPRTSAILQTNSILTLKPTNAILFDASDEVLCQRAMGFTEIEATMRQCLRHQMLPRIDAYRERNEEHICLANLFYDNDLIPMHILVETDTQEVDTLRKIKTEIGHAFTYPLTAQQQQALNKSIAEKRLKDEEEQRRKKEELVKSLTFERERKILEWTAKYEKIKKHEKELREVKTMPLRQYLGKYVFPTLTDGIMKIAELKPDNPADFLAEYLFKCNPEGQQMPPFCTEEQRVKFYNTFCDDLATTSDEPDSSEVETITT